MDYILYLLIFCMGTVFGSFFTLAVYRIPLRQDITHTRSYCPKCNHKLSFFDMIPVLSYIFLGGKCRYCKDKIRPRYFLLEILSGIVFLLFALSIKFSIYTLTVSRIVYISIGILYIATLFITAGIDKENIKIEKPVILFGFICVAIYMIYLYIIEKDSSVYKYVIYLILVCLLMIINNIYLRKKGEISYPADVLLLTILMTTFTYEVVTIYTIIITLLSIAVHMLLHKYKLKKNKTKCVKIDKKESDKLPIAFYMCIANIFTMIIINFYIFYTI